jgi:hypothetical protein
MMKLLLFSFLLLSTSFAWSQQDMFAFKKKNKNIAIYHKDDYFAFKTKDREWNMGVITRIHNDSFYLKPMVIRYSMMKSDTTYYPVLPFTFADVFAVPKTGVRIDYINGRYAINRGAGHVHWYWVKSGWIFRVGSAGFLILKLINGLLKNDLVFTAGQIEIAAGIFLLGQLLHWSYKPEWRMGKKYHLQSIRISK